MSSKAHHPRAQQRGSGRVSSSRDLPATSRRRRPVVIAGFIALALMVVGLVLAFRQMRPSAPPNILLVTIDTLRWDHVGAYRASDSKRGTVTPALDTLAARGTLFVNAICQVPLTLPSHASMLTGLTPPDHAVRDNVGFALAARVPTIVEPFHRAGYATAAFVSGYPLHHRFGLNRAFDL